MGLLELFLSCKVGSILYHAILALFLLYSILSVNDPSLKRSIGVEAKAQAVNGKRKSILVLVDSKSSKYTTPEPPLPICCA